MSSINIVDHALAAADLGLRIFPLTPLSKRPAFDGWQEAATTSAEQILAWWQENPHYNYGIRTGMANNLLVIDLDGPGATAWWRSQGLPDGAKVVTPSGADRNHWYFRVDDVEISNTAGTIFKNVDTRGEGGYVVGPGSVITTGTYYGDLSNIPDATPEILALMPEKQTYDQTPYEGEQVSAASDSELRQTNAIIASLELLPKVWSSGTGWHDVVFRGACWLSRMVNSTAYAMTEEGALAILMSYAPTYEGWGSENIRIEWRNAKTSTAGQYADLPTENVPNLLPFLDVAGLLPKFTTSGAVFTDLLFNDPEINTSGSFWKARQVIFSECFQAGLTDEQAATIVWSAKVAMPLQVDPSGLGVLWGELKKARETVEAEGPINSEAPAAEDRPSLREGEMERIQILTDHEREFVGSRKWWGTDYITWAASRVSMMNLPYHRMNLWTILSLVFADVGFIPKKKGKVGLNLFQMILGNTTTGKTEAFDIMRSVIRACFPDDSPDIGGDASPNALIETLIGRDGKPSFFNADEAHGLFAEMQGMTWRAGSREKWTMLYEGRVPMMLRSGKKDLSGINAVTYFNQHLMGTTSGMMDVLDSEYWTSGFLARYVFAIGHEADKDNISYEEEDQEGDVEAGYNAMPNQWASQFNSIRFGVLERNNNRAKAISMDDDARRRHVEFKTQIGTMFAGHRQEELIAPTLIRFGINVRKCASLVALSEGRECITLGDELIALEQAEEWLTNIVRMVEGTTESGFTRWVNDIEQFISKQKNRESRIERVYSFFKIEKKRTDDYISQLLAEGRIERVPTKDQSQILRIKERIEA